jgi:hypothetical protein
MEPLHIGLCRVIQKFLSPCNNYKHWIWRVKQSPCAHVTLHTMTTTSFQWVLACKVRTLNARVREFVCKKKLDKGAVRVVVHLSVANSIIGRSQLPLACWDCGVQTGGADVCKDRGTNQEKQQWNEYGKSTKKNKGRTLGKKEIPPEACVCPLRVLLFFR